MFTSSMWKDMCGELDIKQSSMSSPFLSTLRPMADQGCLIFKRSRLSKAAASSVGTRSIMCCTQEDNSNTSSAELVMAKCLRLLGQMQHVGIQENLPSPLCSSAL
jgi:hypothetical protein